MDVPVPPTIPADGSADVTTQLNDFLNTLAPGDVAVFPDGGQYRIEGTLRVLDKPGIGLRGKARLYATDQALDQRDRAQLRFGGCDGATVRDLRIEGANPNPGPDGQYLADVEAQHNLVFASCSDVVVEGCEFYKPYGDFVVFSNRDAQVNDPCLNVAVRGCYANGSGRQGFTVGHADGVSFERNVILESKRTSIDLEPNTAGTYAKNVTIRGNYIGRNQNGPINAGGNLGVCTVEGNVFEKVIGRRFNATSGTNSVLIFRNNLGRYLTPNLGAALLIYKFAEVYIEDCQQHFVGTIQNTFRVIDIRNVGSFYLRRNLLPGVPRNRLFSAESTWASIVDEDNVLWPPGYGV